MSRRNFDNNTRTPPRGACGWADLVRALDLGGPALLKDMAAVLGWEGGGEGLGDPQKPIGRESDMPPLAAVELREDHLHQSSPFIPTHLFPWPFFPCISGA